MARSTPWVRPCATRSQRRARPCPVSICAPTSRWRNCGGGWAQSLSTYLRKTAGLPPAGVALLRECAGVPDDLAAAIKALPMRLTATTGLTRAISTAGGLRFAALGELAQTGVFAAGEMLDWEAPTGGYLLQASLSTGFAAGEAALEWLQKRS